MSGERREAVESAALDLRCCSGRVATSSWSIDPACTATSTRDRVDRADRSDPSVPSPRRVAAASGSSSAAAHLDSPLSCSLVGACECTRLLHRAVATGGGGALQRPLGEQQHKPRAAPLHPPQPAAVRCSPIARGRGRGMYHRRGLISLKLEGRNSGHDSNGQHRRAGAAVRRLWRAILSLPLPRRCRRCSPRCSLLAQRLPTASAHNSHTSISLDHTYVRISSDSRHPPASVESSAAASLPLFPSLRPHRHPSPSSVGHGPIRGGFPSRACGPARPAGRRHALAVRVQPAAPAASAVVAIAMGPVARTAARRRRNHRPRPHGVHERGGRRTVTGRRRGSNVCACQQL